MSHHLELFWIMLRAALLSTTSTGNLPIVHQDLLSRGWAPTANSPRLLQSDRSVPARPDSG